MVFIYVLELESNKYYVGKMNAPFYSIEDHDEFKDTNGTEWTTKYKPIRLIEFIPDCDIFDDDKFTLKYMVRYGVDNVRGGTFCKIKLSSTQNEVIQAMIANATNTINNSAQANTETDAENLLNIKRLHTWSIEMSKDHYIYFLFDIKNKMCNIYEGGVAREKTCDTYNSFIVEMNELDVVIDLLYNSDNIALCIGSFRGCKTKQIEKLVNSIDQIMSTDDFVRVKI